jgi:hypothetical protein
MCVRFFAKSAINISHWTNRVSSREWHTTPRTGQLPRGSAETHRKYTHGITGTFTNELSHKLPLLFTRFKRANCTLQYLLNYSQHILLNQLMYFFSTIHDLLASI